MPRIQLYKAQSDWFNGLKFAERLYISDGYTLDEVESRLVSERVRILRNAEYLRGVDDYLGYAREKLRAVHH
ncbi:hypothetical protein Peetri_00211 [Pseudomonas phage vB_PpuM-Peetri]